MGSFVLAIMIFAVALVIMTVKQVPQGYEWTVERFGRYTRTLSPGLDFIWPVFEKVGNKVNVMEQV
ncbi:MAG: SPFH/Band 7/PHB domain protein, partial [Moraxellaceae bacterium]|nr:SPFH/Band 7/PHB domain protein [Moraxellaceae bacterium]